MLEMELCSFFYLFFIKSSTSYDPSCRFNILTRVILGCFLTDFFISSFNTELVRNWTSYSNVLYMRIYFDLMT